MKLVFLFIITVFALYPLTQAQAGFLSFLGLGGEDEALSIQVHNSQTIPLPQAVIGLEDPKGGKGGSEVTVDDGALVSDTGPLGTQADLDQEELPASDAISLYVVREGDSLPVIAKMFGVSVNTIVWANDLPNKNAKIKKDQTLLILPISGVSYKIKKGDTLKSIAKTYKADAEEIGKFNGLELDSKLTIGDSILIPDGEIATPQSTPSSKSLPTYAYGKTKYIPGSDGPEEKNGYFIRPIRGGVRTQGLHGKNGVDLAGVPVGSPVLAVASGVVIAAKSTGWNGGFARYIIIQHPDGITSLYGHLNKVMVDVGQQVRQGEQIGELGNSGRSTGPHLHFEIHGAKNPLGTNPSYGL